MYIAQRPSPNRTVGRQGRTPDLIVCHITDGAFPGSISWVTNPATQVSYHFMVSRAGEVTQCVDIANTAWANGTTNSNDNRDNRNSRLAIVRDRRVNANLYSISIGHEGRHSETQGKLTAPQQAATVSLIRHIREEVRRIWGTDIPATRDHIVGHVDITPETRPNCPGARFPFDEIINSLNTEAAPTPNTTPTPSNAPTKTTRTVTLDIFGNIKSVSGYIDNGATFVRLTDFCAAMGCLEASWDVLRHLPVITRGGHCGDATIRV